MVELLVCPPGHVFRWLYGRDGALYGRRTIGHHAFGLKEARDTAIFLRSKGWRVDMIPVQESDE